MRRPWRVLDDGCDIMVVGTGVVEDLDVSFLERCGTF